MVEVFKTNVANEAHACILIEEIHKNFKEYKANFDLEDCDKILRVECKSDKVDFYLLIELLKNYGYSAEVLSDDPSLEQYLLSFELLSNLDSTVK